ncbi:MAG: LLM class flavin-dependent oxidoreductase [Deltaproteobacteria bacterium]|nr:LLM class flavin-dependent oxidoreductase [Deltaproteobacteria bacterium]
MRFGVNFFPSFRLQDMSTAEYFALAIRLSERADDLGYASVKAVEHYFHDYGGHSPNPIVLLSAIASRTRRIRLITGAAIPAFNHPIKLAGELAMLDNISNGRLDAGFGRAFIPREFDAFGVEMDESRARFEEGIDVITRLWTEEQLSFDGKFHRFHNVRLMPRPVQKPHPPIWIAAVSTKESFLWAGRHGYHIMIVPFASNLDLVRDLVQTYRAAWREAGHPPGAEQVQSSLHCYVAETHREAMEGFKRPVERYIEVFAEAVRSWEGQESRQYAGYNKLVDAISSLTAEKMIDSHTALVGTPDEVIEQVEFNRNLIGEHEPSMQINFGGIKEREAFRTLDLFANHVMPRFAEGTRGQNR